MKTLLTLILALQTTMALANWSEFSARKISTGTGDLSKALSCHFFRTFGGDFRTRVFLQLDELNPNSVGVRDIMLIGHNPGLIVQGKNQNLCDQVEELKTIGWGSFETENVVLTDGKALKEVIQFRFDNGLVLESEAKYTIRE